jgi:hypothetical protein
MSRFRQNVTTSQYFPVTHGNASRYGITSLVLGLLILIWQAVVLWYMWHITRPGNKGGDALGLIGAVGLFACYFGYVASAPPAVLGIIFGVVGLRPPSNTCGLALAGVILNSVLVFLAMLMCVGVIPLCL